MTDRRIRILLWAASTVCAGLGAGSLGVSVMAPMTTLPAATPQRAGIWAKSSSELSTKGRAVDEASFQYVWHKSLQRPIVDPPAPKPPTQSKVKPKTAAKPTPVRFDAELVGTLIDDNPAMTRAWLLIKNKRRMVAEGDTLGDLAGKPSIKSISHQRVDVTIRGTVVSLTKKEPDWVSAKPPVQASASRAAGTAAKRSRQNNE